MTLLRGNTELTAANAALAYLNETPLTSLAERRPAALFIRENFGDIRDLLQRSHPWNFNKRRIRPSSLPDTSPSLFSTVYALPDNCLRVLSVDGLDEDSWAVETRGGDGTPSEAPITVLVTDASNPVVWIVRRVTEPLLWDPLFLDVFAMRLASRIAPLLGKADAVDNLEARADKRLGEARRINNREAARSQVTRSPSFVTSRW
jgi:hypothetical protein